MATYSFREARQCVAEQVARARRPQAETVALEAAAERILAEQVAADRDCPPVARSVRDGFAVRAADLPGSLEIIGEAPAGATFDGVVGPGQAVEIMTGAPVPEGADAIVMVEHTSREGNRVTTGNAPRPGEFINPRAAEARRGDLLLGCGRRLGFPEIALLAGLGKTQVQVFRKPRVAILSTGDEVVPITEQPRDNQVRNSNAWSLAVQVERAGGLPEILPVAPDRHEETRQLIERGLGSDLLLVSGGVSAGKYDLVERVLAELGAEFYFDRVLIQPGQPLVFGRAREVFFFGLPGNPASTMVTFELFARAAVELLAGQSQSVLPMPLARLTTAFRHKTGLTRFLPACLSADGTELTPVAWQGSGDMPALARANAFLVADADRESWQPGDLMQVLLR